MEAIAPSESAVAVLRAIARAGFAYGPTKALCGAAGWTPVDDEPDLGYVRYSLPLAADSHQLRSLAVLIAEKSVTPSAFLPLFYFDEYDEGRAAFDEAFRTLAEQLVGLFGVATSSGEYGYRHREGWPYSFVAWTLPDATFTLVQDEFDIQFGMDVTLWVRPAGSAVEVPVRCE